MQERLTIQSQLERLREECLRDYLAGKLEFIASKEVVSDILNDFMRTNNQEFLESIAESIAEAKENIKRLKETIEKMRREHESIVQEERQRIKEQCRQEHFAEMTMLKEQVSLIKINLQVEGQAYTSKVELLKGEVESLQTKNQELNDILKTKNQTINETTSAIADLSSKLQNTTKKLEESNSLISQLQLRQFQTQQQFAKEMMSLKDMHLKQQAQRQSFLYSQNSSIVNQQRQEYEQKIRDLHSKVNTLQQEKFTYKDQLNRLKNERQKLETFNRESQLKTETVGESLKKLEDTLQHKIKQNQSISQELYRIKQQNKQMINIVESLERKLNKTNIQHLESTALLKETITKLQQEISTLSQAKIFIQQKIEKKYNDFSYAIQKHFEEVSQLKNSIGFKQSQMKILQQRLDAQVEKNLLNQEQIKSLLNYNALHQQHISKLQQEIKRVQQERQAQIRTYHQAFHLNMKGLEEEQAISKQQICQLRAVIKELQRQLEIDHQRQKYYNLYLQEIALLKKELSCYQSAQYQHSVFNKAKRNKVLLEELPRQVIKLQKENKKLKEMISNQLEVFQQNFRKNFKLIMNQVQMNASQCIYCQNQKDLFQRAKSPYNQEVKLDKTLPKPINDKQNISSIKKNIKSIKQKYQIMHSENQSFTNRVEAYLNIN